MLYFIIPAFIIAAVLESIGMDEDKRNQTRDNEL